MPLVLGMRYVFLVGLVFMSCSKCFVSAWTTFSDYKFNTIKKTTRFVVPDKYGLDTGLSRDDSWVHPGLRSSGENGRATTPIFRAFWNAPDRCSKRFGIDLPFTDYGIEFNSNHLQSRGNVVNILGHWLGLYPYLDGRGQPINGGLPQLANITAHLEKVASDILAVIPDPGFDGIGVIDYEAWRPQWDQNFDARAIYGKRSINHVRSMHPEWDNHTVELVAELEWTQGAKVFMESTLKLAKELRPKAMWGFYHFPYCNNHRETVNMTCGATTKETNTDIMWLFNASTALFPSIYLRSVHKYERTFVRSRLLETFRVADKSSDPKVPVFSYARFNYSHTSLFYSLGDLNNTILQSAELATHGIVFWGTLGDDQSAQSCSELRDYINSALGPAVAMARHGAMSCSKRVCSGHGRCVGNIFTCDKERGRNEWVKGKIQGKYPKKDVCTCRCFKGWAGGDCSA